MIAFPSWAELFMRGDRGDRTKRVGPVVGFRRKTTSGERSIARCELRRGLPSQVRSSAGFWSPGLGNGSPVACGLSEMSGVHAI